MTNTLTWDALAPGLAAHLTTHLDGDWTVDHHPDHTWGVWLDGPAGQRLLIAQGDRHTTPQRVSVTGCLPTRTGPLVNPTIGVALARGPAAIARDITRRLLPGYASALAEAHSRLAEQASEMARRHALRDDLVAALPGGRVVEHGETDYRSEVYAGDTSTGSVTAHLHGAGASSRIEFRWIDPDLLRALAAVYAAHQRPRLAATS